MAKVAMIIAFENFRDEELFHPKESLEKAGHEAVLFSLQKGTAKGAYGATAKIEHTIDELNVDDFSAIVFIGGAGSSVYFNNETAQKIAKDAYSKGKVVAAICIAPSTLANAGLLKGKRATCYASEGDNLKAKGANYTAEPVEVDGKIITASGPAAARDFGKQIGKLI